MKFIEVTTEDNATILLNTNFISEIGRASRGLIAAYLIIRGSSGYNICHVLNTYEDIKAQLEGIS